MSRRGGGGGGMANRGYSESSDDLERPRRRDEVALDYEDDLARSAKGKAAAAGGGGGGDGIMQQFARARDFPFEWMAKHPKLTNGVICLILFVLYNAYLTYCILRLRDEGLEWEWCDGLGFLIILTGLVYLGLFYYQIFKPFVGPTLQKAVITPITELVNRVLEHKLANLLAYALAVGALAAFIIVDSWEDPERLTSGAGILVILAVGFVCSKHPGHVNWRPVIWGIGIEFIFGIIVLRWQTGRDIFKCLGDKVKTFLDYTDEGSSFVFGFLVTGKPFLTYNINASLSDEHAQAAALGNIYNEEMGFDSTFMFKTLSVIYFFSFVVSMLFYLGALQWVVMKMGWMLYMTLGTTAAESLNAAANVFLGQTEAPLLVKPFLPVMTKSEIHAVMTGGFATIAGTVLAAYISFGIDAAQLISASVMAAPAALAFSKLFYPETEESKTKLEDIHVEKGEEANMLDAAAQGASTAIMLVLNIAASLIAFLAFIGFLNGIIGWMGGLAGVDDLTFEFLLGKCFIPIAYILGVPAADTEQVARLIGLKTTINEFKAYEQLGALVSSGQISPRAEAIATFALCGFANPGSIGIQLGGLGALAPTRKTDLADIVLRAFVSGCMTSLLNACVAGSLISTL